jgi:hypothetical protein
MKDFDRAHRQVLRAAEYECRQDSLQFRHKADYEEALFVMVATERK